MDEDPHVTEEQLFENFKSQLGSMQNLRKNLTVLKQQGFILGVRGTTSMIAGPAYPQLWIIQNFMNRSESMSLIFLSMKLMH